MLQRHRKHTEQYTTKYYESDRRWHSFLPDENSPRKKKPIAKRKWEDLADEIVAYYEAQEEGIETARQNGKQIGGVKGATLNIKKKAPAKEIILKHSKDFYGTLSDSEVIKLTGLSRNTYYKYKKELKLDTRTNSRLVRD